MDVTLRVIHVLEPLRGTSRKDGSEWVKYYFVGETVGEQYTKKMCIGVMGDELWGRANIRVGETYNISFDIESREWQGRWFTDLRAWKIFHVDSANAKK